MLVTECDKSGRACRFVVSPNNSHGARGKVLIFIAIVLVSIMIAFRFWLLGAWMVMPLMLLEMAVLGGAFYLVEYHPALQIPGQTMEFSALLGSGHPEQGQNQVVSDTPSSQVTWQEYRNCQVSD